MKRYECILGSYNKETRPFMIYNLFIHLVVYSVGCKHFILPSYSSYYSDFFVSESTAFFQNRECSFNPRHLYVEEEPGGSSLDKKSDNTRCKLNSK